MHLERIVAFKTKVLPTSLIRFIYTNTRKYWLRICTSGAVDAAAIEL